MNKFKNYVGIDISKEVFDAVLLSDANSKSLHQQFDNSSSGCKSFIKWLKVNHIELTTCLVCFEHTGMYPQPLPPTKTT